MLHKLSIDQNLMDTETIVVGIGGIGCFGYLFLSPLGVGGYRSSRVHDFFEFAVDTLAVNAAFALDQW